MATTFATVDEYVESYPEETRAALVQVRSTILAEVSGAEEKIRYGMPAVMLGGRYAIHYAAWKHHIGLYPVPVLDDALESELAPYRAAKDSVNFVYSAPIPYDLIGRVAAAIVALRS